MHEVKAFWEEVPARTILRNAVPGIRTQKSSGKSHLAQSALPADTSAAPASASIVTRLLLSLKKNVCSFMTRATGLAASGGKLLN